MQIIEKSYKWNGTLEMRQRTDLLIIHHAAARTCSADDVHRWHLDNGWSGIGYNYFIRKDGTVYRGRPETAVGAHTEGYNSRSVGVCFEGNYDVEVTMPAAQKKAGQELVAYLKGRYPGIKVTRHKDYDATACPGKFLPFDEIAGVKAANSSNSGKEMCQVELEVLSRGSSGAAVRALQRLLIADGYSCGASRDDGDFGADTAAAVRKYQKAKKIASDGIVGSDTWSKLLK